MYLYNSGPSETEHGVGPERPVVKGDDGHRPHKEPEPAPAAEVEEQKPEEEKPAEEQPAEEKEEAAPPAKEEEGDNKPSERDPVSSGRLLSPSVVKTKKKAKQTWKLES